MALELEPFRKSISSLQQLIALIDDRLATSNDSNELRNGLRAGAIRYFEFTYELAWKLMKRWLENNMGSSYVDGVSRRELYRIAAEHRLIDDVDQWMDYHHDRNLTSHTYDEDVAKQVYETARCFIGDALNLYSVLQAHND